ncbi:hypothetical protein DESUT3_22460 [Desulfuromonas versatilis]|uniref:Bacterial sugar transferase domain-containing protein n=1 Tax=Desulfuromonas versatilis TaxID=2802975 RepID=A0ABN6DYI4_9BACT|nr:sugar transferase [Desulfuromonas versatilis]BCR05177.1 hypothetical protein DESUT3_22460 [Desulfuromonas versatilis]
MLRQQSTLFTRLTIALDVLVIILAFLLAYEIRRQFNPDLFAFHEYIWTLLVIIPVWVYLLARQGMFASIRRLSRFEIVARIASVHVWGAFIVAAVIFFTDRQVFSRSFFLIFVLASFGLLTLEKGLLRAGLGVLRRLGYNFRQILIVGTRDKARRFQQLLIDHADWGLRVAGFVQVTDPPLLEDVDGIRVLGHVDDLLEICKRHTVDEVVFCLPKDLFLDADGYVRDLEELGITVRMVLDFYEIGLSRKELSFFHEEIPILTFHSKCFDAQQLLAKRCLDICGALVGLGLTLVLSPLIVLAIKLDSPGPVFFCQPRVGQGGRSFKCCKFRSMQADAESRKKDLESRNEMNGAIFKIKDDPRITRVGRFLRRTSLDELPQFWNVLKGEMSLVGTRPPTPAEVDRYENWQRRRISIKPGISGLWQVSGRSRIDDFDEIVKLDLQYIDNWSLWLDIRILLKTLVVVFTRQGSC